MASLSSAFRLTFPLAQKPQRRLHRPPTHFSPSPPSLPTSASTTSVYSNLGVSSSALPAARADFASTSPSLIPASASSVPHQPSLPRSSLTSSLPSFRSVRRRRLASAPLSPAAITEVSDDDEVTKEQRRGSQQRRQQGRTEEEREEERREGEVSLPALESEDGQVILNTANSGLTCGPLSLHSGAVIDLTNGVAADERTRSPTRVRRPLAPLTPNTLQVRTVRSTSASSVDVSRKRRRHDTEATSSSALHFIHSVCDAVKAARLEKQRKRKSARRKAQQEVIEVMSEQSASEDDNDEATVTHIVRQPADFKRNQLIQPSDQLLPTSPTRPCIESVKSREVRASLPGYACADCHAFHSVAHGERAGHLEALCRHKYSQSANTTQPCTALTSHARRCVCSHLGYLPAAY